MSATPRAVVGSPATISQTFYNDETSIPADGTVTVAITDLAGNAIASGNATQSGTTYTFAVPPPTQTQIYTVVWSGTFSGVVRTVTTQVDVTGGNLFDLAELRSSDVDLTIVNYPTQLLKDIRAEVEDEFRRITNVSFVPRYARETMNGTGTSSQVTKWPFVTKIRSVTVTQFGSTPTVYTSPQLAALSPTPDGSIVDTSGMIFFLGLRNVLVEYEHGWTSPPADIRRAALTRARTRLTATRSGVPDRTTSFSAAEGGTFALATPGRAGYTTGIPEVDAVLAQYSMRLPGVG